MDREINKIRKLEDELKQKDEVISSIQIEKMKIASEKIVLERRVQELEKENLLLKNKIKKFEIKRPKITTSSLTASFGAAADEMQKELLKTGYTLKDFEVELKANIVYTDEGLRVHLPSVDEEILPDTLSKIKFGIKTIVKTKELEYEEIPHLKGLNRKIAEDIISKKGFKIGEIKYREWDKPDVVLEQFPLPHSLGEAGCSIDLVISKERKFRMPDLIGLTLDEAKSVIEKNELELRNVEKIPSKSPENTVIEQNPPADVEIERGESVDLRISKKEEEPAVPKEKVSEGNIAGKRIGKNSKKKIRISRVTKVSKKSDKSIIGGKRERKK